jgi:hypothetical protein
MRNQPNRPSARSQRVGFAGALLVLASGSMLTACSSVAFSHDAPTAVPTSSSSGEQSTPAFPVTDPGETVDAASQHQADLWLAGAVVPAAAVRSDTRPDGVASGTSTGMWCQPMADAVGYWTLPSMSAHDTLAWLRSHPSQGMQVTGGNETPQAGNSQASGGTVVDEPAPMSLEAVIFTVTSMGSGSGIRADAFAKAHDSVCATAPPGTELGIGG